MTRLSALSRRVLLYLALRANDDAAVTRAVCAAKICSAHYYAARRIVGTGHVLQKLFRRKVGIFYERLDGVYNLDEVMRRDIRSHTDGNTVAAVYEKVGETGRKHGRLLERVVEVRIPIDCFLVYVAEHFARDLRKSRFRVTHCRRGIAVHTAEIAVTVYKRLVYREVLRKADESVVNRAVAVRVIFTEHVTDDTRALSVRLVGKEVQFAHRIEYAAVYGFESVANVGYRTRDVDRHCVRDERFFHLVHYLAFDYLCIVDVLYFFVGKFSLSFCHNILL